MTIVRQPSFRVGEVAPPFQQRTDLPAYPHALRRCRNMIVTQHGAAVNRPGLIYQGEVKDHARRARLIPFIFANGQAFELEFGHLYIRFWKDGAQVLVPAAAAWSGATTYAVGDLVSSGGIVYVSKRAGNLNRAPGSPSDWWLALGAVGVPLELATSFTEDHLREIKYAQMGDIVTLTHKAYPTSFELCRYGNSAWLFRALTYTSVGHGIPTAYENIYYQGAVGPLGIAIEYDIDKVITGQRVNWRYAVTMLLRDNATRRETETLPYEYGTGTGITVAVLYGMVDPPVGAHIIDSTIPAWNAGTTYAKFAKVTGSDGRVYESRTNGNLNSSPIESENIGWYNSWQRVIVGWRLDANTLIGVSLSLPEHRPTIHCEGMTAPAGYTLLGYRIYRGAVGFYGRVMELPASTPQWIDDGGVDPDYTRTPPSGEDPFANGNTPGATCFFDQRRLLANTPVGPGELHVSKLADLFNFGWKPYVVDEDAFRLTLASLRFEEIRWLLPLRALLIGTSEGLWVLSGAAGADDALTAQSFRVRLLARRPVAALDPLVIGQNALFLSALGNAIHDLAYDFGSDAFQTPEVSLLASHLLGERTIVEWAAARAPHSVAWPVRDDGVLLGLSYVRDLEVLAWHWHDTAGAFESICSVPAGADDRVTVIVRRTINGQTKRYIERFATRRVTDARLGVFLDSALTYDGRNAGATTLTVTEIAAGGYDVDASVTVAASAPVFTAQDVGNHVILDPDALAREDGDGNPLPPLGPIRLEITGFTSATEVTALVVTPAVPAELRAVATTAWARAVDELSGLDHLEGETVTALADGSAIEGLTVEDGSVVLALPAAVIHVGLPYVSELETLDMPFETVRGKPKNVKRVLVDVEDARGIEAGRDLDHLARWEVRSAAGGVPQLFTGQVDLRVSGAWEKTGRVAVRQRLPYPVTVLGVSREVEVGG